MITPLTDTECLAVTAALLKKGTIDLEPGEVINYRHAFKETHGNLSTSYSAIFGDEIDLLTHGIFERNGSAYALGTIEIAAYGSASILASMKSLHKIP